MHIDFVIPTNGSLTAGFEAYEKKAKKSCMDYGFHMAITKWDETVSREMELMVKVAEEMQAEGKHPAAGTEASEGNISENADYCGQSTGKNTA